MAGLNIAYTMFIHVITPDQWPCDVFFRKKIDETKHATAVLKL